MRRWQLALLCTIGLIALTGALVAGTAIGGLPVDDRDFLPAEKRALVDQEATEAAEGQLAPRATSSNPLGIPRPVETRARITPTIIPLPQSRNGMMFENVWVENVENGVLAVYAGSWTRDRAQGLVLLQESSREGKIVAGRIYETTERAGPLRIMSVEGMRVNLEAENGDAYVFDLETDELIEPAGTPLPATPEPSASSVAVDTAVPVGQQ